MSAVNTENTNSKSYTPPHLRNSSNSFETPSNLPAPFYLHPFHNTGPGINMMANHIYSSDESININYVITFIMENILVDTNTNKRYWRFTYEKDENTLAVLFVEECPQFIDNMIRCLFGTGKLGIYSTDDYNIARSLYAKYDVIDNSINVLYFRTSELWNYLEKSFLRDDISDYINRDPDTKFRNIHQFKYGDYSKLVFGYNMF